jgi:hypothetical protein
MRVLPGLAGIVIALALPACGPNATTPGAGGGGGTPPAGLTKVSELGQAAYADLAVGADGVLHAIYREEHPTSHRHQIYYRASTDGGATWSAPLNLGESDPVRHVGFLRAAVDGDGRVYAVWWAGKTASGAVSNVGGSMLEEGTLVYRVLEGGAWSPMVQVGEADGTYSWFPSVDPAGRLHLVWLEDAAEGSEESASIVRRAAVVGEAVEPPETVFEAPAVPHRSAASLVVRDRYEAMRGFVDADGKAHWTAVKRFANDQPSAPSLVHFDGARERELVPLAEIQGPAALQYPPQLLRDARGRDHVVYVDPAGERPRLLDQVLTGGDTVAIVRPTTGAGGQIAGFQAIAGPAGKALAFVALKDEQAAAAFDMHLVAFDGAAWGGSTNLTGNAARQGGGSNTTGLGGSVGALVQYAPRFATGAFGPDGRANVLLVNDERTSFQREATDAWGESTAFGGQAVDSWVFYVKP